jgi:hypothetical protein
MMANLVSVAVTADKTATDISSGLADASLRTGQPVQSAADDFAAALRTAWLQIVDQSARQPAVSFQPGFDTLGFQASSPAAGAWQASDAAGTSLSPLSSNPVASSPQSPASNFQPAAISWTQTMPAGQVWPDTTGTQSWAEAIDRGVDRPASNDLPRTPSLGQKDGLFGDQPQLILDKDPLWADMQHPLPEPVRFSVQYAGADPNSPQLESGLSLLKYWDQMSTPQRVETMSQIFSGLWG